MRIAASALLGSSILLSGSLARALPPAPEESPDERMDLVGFRDGFFIRDSRDRFRFYPTGLLHVDFYSSFGPGTTDDPSVMPKKSGLPSDVDQGLKPHLFLRRARIGFAGEILKRWSFMLNVEFGGQAVGNAAGTAETSAAPAGQNPTAASGRYAPLQTIASAVTPLDAYINYSVGPWLNFMLGQVQMPFSMENQTSDAYGTWMERNMAIRAFAAPGPREIGGTIWGDVGEVFGYAVGVFGGDGQNRPSVDARVDFMGRLWARPFAGSFSNDFAKYFQIGVSARHGDRDPKYVGYDYTPISTGQGYVLWKPTYTDSQGRQEHIIPSGSQNAIGGELRLRAGRFALQGEGYYVINNTREAVDGFQLGNSERFGRMKGVGWYGQLSAWPWGDPFVAPEPGVYKPRHTDLSAPGPAHSPRGLEIMAIAAGVDGSYDGASRLGSAADAKTPSGNIQIYQLGVGTTFWYTRHARFTVNYTAYLTPGSGTADNLAVVPDNLRKLDDGKPSTGHVLHEMGARMAVTF